jgi:hypothetical protein
MIISIHQPAYIPWLGYFDKIARSDVHIFLDDAEYSKNNLFNRNKIKTPQGWMWLTIPVHYKNNDLICETKIVNTFNWRKEHWHSIKANYSKAEYFKDYSDGIENFYLRDWENLADFTSSMNMKISEILGIKVKFLKSSEVNVPGKRTERLVNLCKAIGADTYLSGVGGKNYMDLELFKEEHIRVEFQDFKHPVYPQRFGDFIPNLSIIDVLFNCGDKSLDILKRGDTNENISNSCSS